MNYWFYDAYLSLCGSPFFLSGSLCPLKHNSGHREPQRGGTTEISVIQLFSYSIIQLFNYSPLLIAFTGLAVAAFTA